jgi:predicted outer membrane protein
MPASPAASSNGFGGAKFRRPPAANVYGQGFFERSFVMRRSMLAIAAVSTAMIGGFAVQAQQNNASGTRNAGAYRQEQTRRAGEFNENGQDQARYRAGFRGKAAQGMTSLTDRQIVEWLEVDNQNEIALAEIAEERASDSDVKKFARQMVDEHTEFLQKLNRTIGNSRIGQPRQQTGQQQFGQQQRQTSQQPQQAGQFAQGRSQQQGLDLVALKHQLGEQCRQSASRELQQKSGAEFDKCYIGMQIGMHMQMLDTLKVFSRYASPELDQLIEKGEETTQSHLDHAKKIIASLEGQSDAGARSARRQTRDRDESSDERSSKR